MSSTFLQRDDYFSSVNETLSNYTNNFVTVNRSLPERPATEPILPADNSHIVIPLMSFVFGFPVLVMTILCIIQERNKWIYERQAAVRLQQARLSTTSTLYTGLNPARSLLYIKEPVNSVVYSTNDQPLRNGCCHKGKDETIIIMDNLNQKGQCLGTKLSDETLEEVDELETDNNSKNICSISADKISSAVEL